MKFLIAAILFVAIFANINAKIYSKCELVRTLYNSGIPQSQLRDWACLVQHESSYNSKAKGGPNKNGSYDYGIFQINSKYWCGIGKVGGDCNLNCNSLLTDDISDDIRCAKIIYKRHNFSAWYGWVNHCKGKALPSISEYARVFTNCQFVQALSRVRIPKGDLPTWACIAQHESNYNTSAVNNFNTDGSKDFGIFQINSRYWLKLDLLETTAT
ncbi:hypothetical protein PVAND_001248 [Polypedilum vanderplanki]|uniref:Glycosyl hydrolases family 22 (GH22) domain-containing protein n=1 Tax=Polypedilum vanderplanki TaxID=319348 RepID=A0A9J6BNN8_POLVA|nr:hypothetical protein PVAND_001248 [Polypedilum vanderplanki]